MFACRVRGLLLLCLATALVGCSNPSGLDSVQVTPATQSLAVGQTAQFTATGTYGNASHPTTQIIASGVTWSSSAPSVATVDASSGLATAVGAGTATITAGATAFNGHVSSSATLTVTASGGGTAGGTLVLLAVIPGSQSVASPNQTSQFLAIGTTSSGATVNLTNQVTWSSSSPQIAKIGAATGLATAVGQGTDTITALYTNAAAGTVLTGTATFTVIGGTTEQFTAVAITPTAEALSASGQQGQLIALGTSGSTGLLEDVSSSSQIKWISSVPSIASVGVSTGLVTGVSAGTTTITAELTNSPDSSVVSNTATVTVSNSAAPQPLLSLTIIPSVITVENLQDTGQFLAIGTFSTPPTVRDLTNSPTLTWISAAPNIFPINNNTAGTPGASAGTVTAYGNGSGVIIAEAKSSDGTIQTATATFNCPLVLPTTSSTGVVTAGSCYQGSQAPSLLATLTVYNQGLNTSGWLVTAPSATNTPDVIHCGPASTTGGSVCEATYPIGSQVILTAPAEPGVAFGGWSYNCVPTAAITATGPNSCTVTLTTNDTVGAIFN